ncbi:hypothetical protein [Phaeobacter sp. B1627]|uniref:hypothetical protein n=1 Tax=Phaeobacter sp. B1627 TaxID=2583809 RepID=UPI00111B1595|nr:hypothetical protein [Phaeobacter sp. B1627]TNJ38828.1 hypothetical protein FGE21_19385 [Phaeobacter sp. B1627]
MKKVAIVFPAFATLIFAGFIQPIDTMLFDETMDVVTIALLLAWSAPALPAVLVILRIALPRPASPALIWPVAIAVFLAGLFLTFASTVLSSPHSTLLSLTHGGALSLAGASSVLCLAIGRIGSNGVRLALSGMALSAAAAAWSLLAVPSVVFQAKRISAGYPLCISHHGPSLDVSSIWDLRGFDFYTTDSGYKSTSGWYFHGILIVDGNDGRQYFNWSPRRFRFDRVEHPERFIASLRNLCEPSSAFWSEL